MPDPFGLSFMPGEQGNGEQNGQQPTPVQQAIQTLSLRIPRTVGAASGAPQSLLMGAGGSALGGNPNSAAILEQIRRMLFGGGANFGNAMPSGGLPPMGAPGAPVNRLPNPNIGFTPDPIGGAGAPAEIGPGPQMDKPNLPPQVAPLPDREPREMPERGGRSRQV